MKTTVRRLALPVFFLVLGIALVAVRAIRGLNDAWDWMLCIAWAVVCIGWAVNAFHESRDEEQK